MGLFGGLLKVIEGVVKTGIGVVADVATLVDNAIEDELRKLKEGLDKILRE